jgi:VWFA-related protein
MAALAIVGAAAAPARSQQVPVFRTAVDLVNLGVTVTDRKGNLVTDLNQDAFEIVEDSKKQTIRYFAAGEGEPGPELHLGVLLDVSESMGEDIAFTRTAAIKFLNTLTKAVDITLVDFDTEVRAARFSQAEFARLVERIRGQKAQGWTALYDAIGVYLDGAAQQSGRKVMLLYTDGGDTRSSLRLRELMDLLKASDVTIYAIGELEHASTSERPQQTSILRQLADATGGQAFFPLNTKDLTGMYDKVLAEVRAQYTIGYQSTNDKTDGAWRKVDIKVATKDGHDLRVRARKGYYGPYKKP